MGDRLRACALRRSRRSTRSEGSRRPSRLRDGKGFGPSTGLLRQGNGAAKDIADGVRTGITCLEISCADIYCADIARAAAGRIHATEERHGVKLAADFAAKAEPSRGCFNGSAS